jgi:hypothetical protein
MTYQEKLIRLALAVLAELRRIPDYNDEAARRLRGARNGHGAGTTAEATAPGRDTAPLPRRRPRVDA